ncbi:MAG: hypothetical protein AB7F99_15020 [Vicinamibacterales bacterium]
MTRRVTMAVAVLIVTMLWLPLLRAHEGHKIMGTVTMAAVDHVMLNDTNGKAVTVVVTKDTKVKADSPMRVEEIRAGTRVVITATDDREHRLIATLIEVGVSAPTAR